MPLRSGILSILSLSVLLFGCQQNEQERSLPEETDNNRYIQVEDSNPTEQKTFPTMK